MTQAMTTTQALAYFDELEPVTVEALLGEWEGTEVATGHPMEGMLAATSWYGKTFHSADAVDPLVHLNAGGKRFCVNPALLPIQLGLRIPYVRQVTPVVFPLLRPFIATRKPKARLRMMMYRGKLGAAMIYDAKPIIDIFRKIDDKTVLGLMDQRGDDVPYFFKLSRV